MGVANGCSLSHASPLSYTFNNVSFFVARIRKSCHFISRRSSSGLTNRIVCIYHSDFHSSSLTNACNTTFRGLNISTYLLFVLIFPPKYALQTSVAISLPCVLADIVTRTAM